MSTLAGEIRQPVALADLAEAARRLVDRPALDYIDGGAGDERTLRANVAAFDRVSLLPTMLSGVTDADASLALLGDRWAAPVGVAPMAFHRLVHPGGETETARGAAAVGLPVVVSTFASTPFPAIREAVRDQGGPRPWLQLYCYRDRTVVADVLARAAREDFAAIMLTVDATVLGRRLRDRRNGFRIPPDIAPVNLLQDTIAGDGNLAGHGLETFDRSLTWDIVDELRSMTSLPILVKGLLTAEDGARAVQAGVDGVVVSNHGGRQLDGAPAALDALPEVAAAVSGQVPVLVDGGVRRGVDILAALALGATAVLVGRPVLHALAVDGAAGVAGALSLLADELRDAMVLTGRASLAECDASLVRRA